MLDPRTCKHCGKEFLPKRNRQEFCCRSCYTTNYRAEKNKDYGFPNYRCWNCGHVMKLTFDPIKDHKTWIILECEKCKCRKCDDPDFNRLKKEVNEMESEGYK